jgi:cytochrome c-type biogenesis protein CcmE
MARLWVVGLIIAALAVLATAVLLVVKALQRDAEALKAAEKAEENAEKSTERLTN